MAYRRKAAGPSGSALLEQMRGKLGDWPGGLTVLTGEDAYHLDRAQRMLLAALLPPETSEFALGVFGDESVEIGVVVGAARSVGMFAPRRVVHVRDVECLGGEPEALTDYAAAPPANSYLIVRADKLDQRRKLHKALATSGTTVVFESPGGGDPDGLQREVKAIAGEHGLQLDGESVEFLAEASGGDLYRVASEIEKIATWCGGGRSSIGFDQVRQVSAGGGMLSGWEVANAVLLRDGREALSAARRLVESGEEPIKVVGGLAWRARVMIEAKAMLDAGVRPDQVLRSIRAWGFKDQLLTGMRRYSMSELLEFPKHLMEADRCFKSRGLDRGAVLEQLVRNLVGPAAAGRDGLRGQVRRR